MAKSKSFFGLRRGSTKSHTYQVFRGEQITKDRVYEVSNPQTTAQMVQRLKLPMVAQTASILKPILEHSFEGVEYGEQSLKNFRQINLKSGALTIKQYVPKGMINTGLADYTIATGSLASPGKSGSSLTVEDTAATMEPATDVKIEDLGTVTDGETPTAAQLAIIQKWFFGNLAYDQITVILGYKGNDYTFRTSSGANKTINYVRYIICRLVFDTSRYAENADWKWKVNNGNTTLTNGYIIIDFGITADNSISFKIESAITDDAIQMAAAISSKLENNTWKRSVSKFIIGDNSTAVTYEEVLNTYLSASSNETSEKYLNAGSESVTITGGDATSAQGSN